MSFQIHKLLVFNGRNPAIQAVRIEVGPLRARWIRETLFAKWSTWLVFSIPLVALAMLMDDSVGSYLAASPHTQLRNTAHFFSHVGEWYMMAAAGIVCSLFLFALSRWRQSRDIIFVTLTGLATGLTGTILRCLVGRARPDADVPQGFYGFWHASHFIFGQHQFGSFPSGHVATAAGFAAAAWLINRRAGFCMSLFAALVAWSRIAQSAHHFSDVIAAALWAIIGALLMRTYLKPLFISRFNHLRNSWLRIMAARRIARTPAPSHPISPQPVAPVDTLTSVS